jgi:hypothetical protein
MTTTASDAFLEALAVAASAQGAWVALHTGPPGKTGANELTGGSPAYGRKQTTWVAGATDGMVTGSEVEINVPATTITHYSLWTAATGGQFLWSVNFPGSGITFPGQAVLKVIPKPFVETAA